MGTVNKVAAQLQVGDIYTCQGGRAVVVHMVDRGAFGVLLYTAVLGRQPLPVMAPPETTSWEAKFCVEVPEPAPLTPAQQLAEELRDRLQWLLGFVSTYARGHMGPATPEFDKVRALLDKVMPPNPPTLAEVLAALELSTKWANLNVDNLGEGDREACDKAERNAVDVLNRARRAGML